MALKTKFIIIISVIFATYSVSLLTDSIFQPNPDYLTAIIGLCGFLIGSLVIAFYIYKVDRDAGRVRNKISIFEKFIKE
ncbi:MAG: DUF2627 family protein [Methanosarcinales archaeon]